MKKSKESVEKSDSKKEKDTPVINQPNSANLKLTTLQTPAGYVQNGMSGVKGKPINCPPGLEYLLLVDQILVQQKVEILEIITRWETNNQYVIKNTMGQHIYLAAEDTNFCTRNCCGPCRPFDIRIMDHTNTEVMHVSRPLRCDCCCCPCCLQMVEVEAPLGNVIGYVKQDWSCCYPEFTIENSNGDPVLKISGPFCTYSLFCDDVEYEVLSLKGSVQIGRITKQWSGFLREAYTDADNYGIAFPIDLDVNIKACLIGACLLIDFMFYEKAPKSDHNDHNRI